MDERLIEYIKRQIEKGFDAERIKKVLVDAGHDINNVDFHINHVLSKLKIDNKKIIIEKKPSKNSRKKFNYFLILLIVLGLLVFFIYLFTEKESKESDNIGFIENVCDEVCKKRGNEMLNRVLIENDEKLCNEIVDKITKDNCINNFENKNNDKFCDEICNEKKLLNKAFIENNLNLCNDISNLNIKVQCEDFFKKKN